MKTILPLIFALAGGFTILTTACAPKDKGFESKTFINKDTKGKTAVDGKDKKDSKKKEVRTDSSKKEVSIDSQTNNNGSQSTDTDQDNSNSDQDNSNSTENTIIENTIIENVKEEPPVAQEFISQNNPSNMKDTQLVVHVKKIQSLNGNQDLTKMPLEAQVVLYDQKARHGYLLGKMEIKNQDSNNDDLIDVNESITISRQDINDRIINLASMSANPSLMIEVNLVRKTEVEADSEKNASESCDSLSSVRVGLFDISRQEQEVVGSAPNCPTKEQNKEQALLISVGFSTSGEYQIENGFISNSQNLICEVRSESSESGNLLIHINNKNLRLINDAGSTDVINLFYKVIVDPLASDPSIIASHKVNFSSVENGQLTITAKSQAEGVKSSSFTSIKEEACEVEGSKLSSLSKFRYSADVKVSEQQMSEYKGCCLPSGDYINGIKPVPTSNINDTHSILTPE